MAKAAVNITHLNDSFALDAKCPEGKRFIVWQDKDTPCFSLRIMQTGSISWLMNNRTHGQRTLGKVSEIKASKARVMAEEMLELVKTGKEVEKKAKDKPTLRTAMEMFWRKKNSGEIYQKGMSTTLTIYGRDILDKPMEDIDAN